MIMRRLCRRMGFELPVVDANALLSNTGALQAEAKKAVDCLHKYGVMILKDPRVDERENDVDTAKLEIPGLDGEVLRVALEDIL